jgi:hypothetical protein
MKRLGTISTVFIERTPTMRSTLGQEAKRIVFLPFDNTNGETRKFNHLKIGINRGRINDGYFGRVSGFGGTLLSYLL